MYWFYWIMNPPAIQEYLSLNGGKCWEMFHGNEIDVKAYSSIILCADITVHGLFTWICRNLNHLCEFRYVATAESVFMFINIYSRRFKEF